ncbi:MAG: hypothetical protein A2X28_07285 [Elusimicrobia bacterium GWA2_56_46]|nr:MAG: hypothetical protein A2X28_07285 [Elusimicrobia bacterium GWA2_56_46]OGR54752.1 MAG: hypothetical protein A2X39_10705 [Elusimicrobia bacterium GWC2_56_31]
MFLTGIFKGHTETVENLWKPRSVFVIITQLDSDMKSRNKIFDSFAEEYDSFRPEYPVGFVKKIAKHVRLVKQSKLLEIGCGSGQATRAFGKLDFDVLAIDPSEALISIAKKRFSDTPSVSFECLSFEEYKSDSQRYDFIFAANSFHWISPEVAWGKAHRLLKPGKHLAILTIRRELESGLKDELDILYQKFNAAFTNVKSSSPVPGSSESSLSLQEKYFFPEGNISYEFDTEYDSDSYLGLMRTMSDHRMLPPDVQATFFCELGKVCKRQGRFEVKNITNAKTYTKKD